MNSHKEEEINKHKHRIICDGCGKILYETDIKKATAKEIKERLNSLNFSIRYTEQFITEQIITIEKLNKLDRAIEELRMIMSSFEKIGDRGSW